MIYLGIDPGLSGAIAAVDDKGRFVMAEEMPVYADGKTNVVDGRELFRLITGVGTVVTAVERVASMPKQGVASTFNFGKAYGTVLGVIGAAGLPRHDVAPQSWKKMFNLIGQEKDASRGMAIKMFPDAPLSRKKDHGIADALLIATWLLRTHPWMK